MKHRRKLFFAILLLLVSLIGVYMIVDSSHPWANFLNQPPRHLRIEVGAPLDQVAAASGAQAFAHPPLQQRGDEFGLHMKPWTEPGMGPVIIDYGVKAHRFSLPASSFVHAEIVAGHVAKLKVKPMLMPEPAAAALNRAQALLNTLDAALPARSSGEPVSTLAEIKLRMALPAKDMDQQRFLLATWVENKPHGKLEYSLMLELTNPEAKTVQEQEYGLELYISGEIGKKLQTLKQAMRQQVPLRHDGAPCQADDINCDVPDMAAYLQLMRQKNLAPAY